MSKFYHSTVYITKTFLVEVPDNEKECNAEEYVYDLCSFDDVGEITTKLVTNPQEIKLYKYNCDEFIDEETFVGEE